ncbi:MAG: protein adenylyltransferase SelO family protein [Xanthomonadales bacterium]|nr:protein adenylyltransferase SelO family protein [Xanthomonadales bacterium]
MCVWAPSSTSPRNGDHEGDQAARRLRPGPPLPRLLDAAENPYQALLAGGRAGAPATWSRSGCCVGFIHGVMNTDNVSIVGETIDYGPFAWMDSYHPERCFSAVDMWGRYAFNQQPQIGALEPVPLRRDAAAALCRRREQGGEAGRRPPTTPWSAFEPAFDARFQAGLRAKLGLAEGRTTATLDLAHSTCCAGWPSRGADFTLTFRRLSEANGADDANDGPVRALFQDPSAFDAWARQWRQRLAQETRERGRARRPRCARSNPALRAAQAPRLPRVRCRRDGRHQRDRRAADRPRSAVRRPPRPRGARPTAEARGARPEHLLRDVRLRPG